MKSGFLILFGTSGIEGIIYVFNQFRGPKEVGLFHTSHCLLAEDFNVNALNF
jgi:hypothetical protein